MKYFSVAAIIGAILLHSGWAAAGPFGLNVGMKLSSLKVIKSEGQDQYDIAVPSPNSEFEAYIATVTPTEGLCKVDAIGRTHQGDFDGTDTKLVFQHLKSVLSQKYGATRDFDFLRAGSIWSERAEWAMAISQNQRNVASFWGPQTGATLPPDIKDISMIVHSTGQASPYIDLTYEFSNFDACQARKTAKENGSL